MQSRIFAPAAHVIGGAASFAMRILIKVVFAGLALTAGTLFIASIGVGFAATALSQHAQHAQQTQPAIELLPPSPAKHYPRSTLAERSEERTLITPVPEEMVLGALSERLCPTQKQQFWQQWMITQLQFQFLETESKPINNELTLHLICWQAFAQAAEALKPIKASELKKVACDLRIKGYRKMNKSELLVAIGTAAA